MTDDAAVLPATTRGGPLETTLHEVVTTAVRHLDATSGALSVLTPDGVGVDRFVTVGPVVPAPAHPSPRSSITVPVRVRDAAFGTLSVSRTRAGAEFTAADVAVARSLAAVAGLAIENARLLERAELRRAWSQAGTEIATALLSGSPADAVLRTAAARVAELSGADAVAVLVPLPEDEETLTVTAAVGPAAEDAEGVRIPLADTRLGAAHRSGAPRLLDAVATGPGAPAPSREIGDLAVAYGSTLLVPLGGSAPLGTLVAARTRDRPAFDPAVLELASAFATQAAVALELVRSQQREQRLQVQTDRDRIARDLHDHVVQRIFATALALDRIGRSLEESAPEVAGRIAERVDELDGTIARIRTSIFELHAAPDPASTVLRSRLADVVRSVTDGHGLEPALRVRGDIEELPADVATELVAVVRELVTNVVRHAGATRLMVTVAVADTLRAVVTDDGRGLPTPTVRSGLANLADRAERRGGRLTVATGSSGTEVTWAVPLPG
ncbi:GAF domain-containing sensor histidine kinase [Blastococcus saxobsidens]|uniref:Two component signal transduction histidine kinase with GAF domain n=1 Tax=Blastococcus saxobsidens (strain DD2) TaxID=1146883 RepID=H6RS93_BLASD|nr:GAF domain-containing protein [Blastococcus saxobsidens]CCG05485.1 Two component signal transduction histidine kinase with GAF domain [Blastococcus saxobsidens DD2]